LVWHIRHAVHQLAGHGQRLHGRIDIHLDVTGAGHDGLCYRFRGRSLPEWQDSDLLNVAYY
jgi:hypothetical protein